MDEEVGVVIIGRNEGARLEKCLNSVVNDVANVVYVDSGSTDGSIQLAHRFSVNVIELDPRLPFTAARARNEGFNYLIDQVSGLKFVQFVDGDSFIEKNWINLGVSFMQSREDVAFVCGRLRELDPQKSVYNMLCDIEWDGPVGEISACGGIAMVRMHVFQQLKGFRMDLIAGEEPELCIRMRKMGWKIWRLDENMAWHDAAIEYFSQWWNRAVRGGYAFAEGSYMHSNGKERLWIKESRRIWCWGFVVPLASVALVGFVGLWGFVILSVYPLQIIRLTFKGTRSFLDNWWYSFYIVLGKFPELIGQVRFLYHIIFGKKARLMEYK